MPEQEISEEQIRRVNNWIYQDGVNGVFVSNLFPGMENGIWRVNGESFVIYSRPTDVLDEFGLFEGFGPARHFVLCSDKHAEELGKLGIVNFSEVTQQV